MHMYIYIGAFDYTQYLEKCNNTHIDNYTYTAQVNVYVIICPSIRPRTLPTLQEIELTPRRFVRHRAARRLPANAVDSSTLVLSTGTVTSFVHTQGESKSYSHIYIHQPVLSHRGGATRKARI